MLIGNILTTEPISDRGDSVTVPLPARPPERYGRAAGGPAPRWVLPLLATLVVLAGLTIAVVGYQRFGNPGVEGHIVGFRMAPRSVTAQLLVARSSPGRTAVCRLSARARSGTEVGYQEVRVPAGPEQTTLTVTLETSDRPVVVDVLGCRYG